MSSRSETIDHVSFLLKEGLLEVYPDEAPDPTFAAALFFDAVPDPLLAKRKELLDRGDGTREWFLVAEDVDPEWAEAMRGQHGVLVVDVEDLEAARRTLRSFLAAGRWSDWRDENPLFPELVLVGGDVEEPPGIEPE